MELKKHFKVSLSYRIAIVFFVLAGMAMTLTLSLSLSRSLDLNRQHLKINENVIIKQILDLCRIALFTDEFDDLQPFIEQSATDPHIVNILMADRDDRIIVSSDVTEIGKSIPKFINSSEQFWRIENINNTSSTPVTLGTLAVKFSHAQLIQTNKEALNLGMKTTISGLIVIGIVGLIIGHLLTRRLSTLSQAAIAISQGNFDVRTNFSSTDEISIVGKAFDHMANSVSAHIRELRKSESKLIQAHDELELRVTQRTSELAVARDDAIAANKTKSKFLASMSHELRTPLNAIIGYSELLVEEMDDNERSKYSDDLEKINSSGNYLLALVSDILDLAKVESGKMTFYLEWFDIKLYVEDILQSLYPLSNKNNSEIIIIFSDNIGTMLADKIKVRQILNNLISNAIKFAPGDDISISAKREIIDGEEWINISVQDNGAGINENKLDKLFNEFSQLEPEKTTLQIGTGLGLSLSQKYCQSMGGNITVQSKKGQGSTFIVRLPARVKAVQAA